MKVVLLKDVRHMGRAHSVIDVADGHAINYLIPGKLAVRASASAVKNAETRAAQAGEKRSVEGALIKQTIAALAEGKVTITKKANEIGHLYDAVNASDIAEAANLPAEVIALEKPIKELGIFTVPVSNGEDFGSIQVEVVAE
jgi:large subunit ribosomal protein L9